ncbi:MAG: LacI family DNA-binding transcriptional regulator [Nocardioides sp.]|uniref:LacI family DNA-binding transcriptional regulator n=1 Tax=Nocardioides sp. TaxID=35761 RepID=UPI0039E6AB17
MPRSTTANSATMRDVAERAGVSVATVSRVITGAAKVQSDRRARVEAAMHELGYQPNHLSANLRNQRVRMIATVVSQIDDPIVSELVQAIQRAASQADYGMLLCTTGDVASTEADQLRGLARQRVAGVVLRSCDPAAPEISELLDLGIPVVALDRTVRDRRGDAVVIDHVEGVRRATQHLLEQGHRRVGFVGGSRDIEPDALRLVGYEAAMREVGLDPITSAESSRMGGGWLGAAKMLDRHRDLTALIAGNGQVALGVLDTFRDRGIHVPDDLSLLVVDDPFWCGLVEPRITTFAAPVQRVGSSAVRLLMRRLENPTAGQRQVVHELELRERRSVATLAG